MSRGFFNSFTEQENKFLLVSASQRVSRVGVTSMTQKLYFLNEVAIRAQYVEFYNFCFLPERSHKEIVFQTPTRVLVGIIKIHFAAMKIKAKKFFFYYF